MRIKLVTTLVALGAATIGCSEQPTASNTLGAGALHARYGGFTMGSGNRNGAAPDTTAQNTEPAPATSTGAGSDEFGGFTMGSGN